MSSSINRRNFLPLGGAALTTATAGQLPLAAAETTPVRVGQEAWRDLPVRALLLSVPFLANEGNVRDLVDGCREIHPLV